MSYFDTFVSASIGTVGSQFAYRTGGKSKSTRVFYRLNRSGTFSLSLLFSDMTDSTFADGSESHAGILCDAWQMRAAVSFTDGAGLSADDCASVLLRDRVPLTFGGEVTRKAPPAPERVKLFDDDGLPVSAEGGLPYPFYASDPVTVTVRAGEYLCLETEVSGDLIPVLRETLMPSFSLDDSGRWASDVFVPSATMIGVSAYDKGTRRPVRFAFLGDSITEGLGTPANAYAHWSAYISEDVGPDFACWNLGLGYGRAADAARRESWLWKACQADVVTVCYGVNDCFRGFTASQICENLTIIVRTLKASGARVILMTVPPFDMVGSDLDKWLTVNRFIRTELSRKADALFDFAAVLGTGEHGERAPYGGHPNPDGCRRLADAFLRQIDLKNLR